MKFIHVGIKKKKKKTTDRPNFCPLLLQTNFFFLGLTVTSGTTSYIPIILNCLLNDWYTYNESLWDKYFHEVREKCSIQRGKNDTKIQILQKKKKKH